MEKFFFCCKGKVLHGQRCLFFPVIPKAAAQVGLQKRLLSFLPDLSHLESLRGSSHTPTEGKKVNSLPGCFSDRGMDALGGQGGVCFPSCFAPNAFFSGPASPRITLSQQTHACGTNVTQGSHFRGFPRRADHQTDHHQIKDSNLAWITHISSSKDVPLLREFLCLRQWKNPPWHRESWQHSMGA